MTRRGARGIWERWRVIKFKLLSDAEAREVNRIKEEPVCDGGLSQSLLDGRRLIRNLDDVPLRFLDDFRLSLQYLSWHFCIQIFRYAMRMRRRSAASSGKIEVSRRHARTYAWGSRGK